MKRRIKILSSTIAVASLGVSVATSAAIIGSNMNINNNSILVNSSTKNDSISDLIPAQSNGQNANISTNAGPVTFNGNVITALDWYGNKLWQKDMSKYTAPTVSGSSQYLGSWKRAWYNWDYDRTNDILWVLGYGYLSNQQIFGFKASDGSQVYEQDLGYVGNGVNYAQSPYKFVTALSSGKVLIYGDPSKTYAGGGALYDPKATTNKVQKLNGDSASHLPTNDGNGHTTKTFKWYFYNLIPLTKGVNLAEFVAFDVQSGTTGDDSSSRASYNVYGLIVDDSLNFIGDKQTSTTLKSAFKIADGVKGFRNTTITPKRDYFTLLNSQTVAVTYNIITLFDTSNPNNITFKQVKMKNPKIIQTWTVDSNDNLYFKFFDDSNVYKVDGETLKSGSDSLSPTTYLDLGGVQNSIVKKDSYNFVIYNVYGYTGQLMMIDESYNDTIDVYKNKLDTTNTTGTNWGLAIAVTTNEHKTTTGDLKGVLNGSDSIQKAVDFDIDANTLKTKLPSEITQSDIKLKNGAFFKEGDPKPFIIFDIDDSKGTFKVTANLYKIPWFADKLPDKSTPKVITYTFDGNGSNKSKAAEIKTKVSWKDLNSSTDYDFMNMLPTNVKSEDVAALNPFQASFQSQTIMKDGKQLYPNTSYEVSGADNNKGTINVKVTYKYVPMSASYTDGNDKTYNNFGSTPVKEQQVVTYTDTKTYTIYNKNEQSAFYFMGAGSKSTDNKETQIDVSTVPQLKNLLSAGTLPSSFESLNSSTDSTNSSFLQFIDTTNSKGFPISKMKFTVTPNDSAGTLSIKAEMPAQYSPDNTAHTYLVKYTGLNKNQSYSFNFKDPQTINNVDKLNILPSSVDEGDIVKNFIEYSGFNSNDLNVVLTPNDEKGTLDVQIKLNDKYAKVIGNSNGFTDYKANKSYTGFMTTDSYNSRFNVTFKGDDDTDLLNLKNIQADELTTAFTGDKKDLTINNKTYTSLNQLVQELLVDKKGTSIPQDWTKDDSGVTTQVYVDNSLGLASFYVNIKKDKVDGASSDLNFVVTYSGFVKGNVDKTGDNLSFVSDKMLKNYLLSIKVFNEDELKTLTPSKFADWVNQNNNVEKLITYKTGQYTDKITAHDYKVTVTPSDIQGNVSITINFGEMKNKQSLSEYSVQYTI